MAKRKTRPGTGSKLHVPKDYRDDAYLPYIYGAESGILEAWALDPDLRDGDVRTALRGIMGPIKKSGLLPPELTAEAGSQPAESSQSLLQHLILFRLREAFDEHGPLDAQDTIGVLTVINNSVGAMRLGELGQEYLKFLKDFMAGLGFRVRQLTEQEEEAMGLNRLLDNSVEGEYREIK